LGDGKKKAGNREADGVLGVGERIGVEVKKKVLRTGGGVSFPTVNRGEQQRRNRVIRAVRVREMDDKNDNPGKIGQGGIDQQAWEHGFAPRLSWGKYLFPKKNVTVALVGRGFLEALGQ